MTSVVEIAPRSLTSKASVHQKFLPEVQALRAAAVAVVVIYHLWPSTLTGGFIGVDVFFAISGFLITGHLIREATATGRIRLLQFWGRRIRRLLPSSLLVLAVSLVGVLALTPKLRWEQFLGEIAASTLYFQNWALAASSIEYGAENDALSPVQHFWSLAVEEQFYLVWPVAIAAVLLLTWKLSAKVKVSAIGVTLLGVTAASLAYSVAFTTSNPSEAYFVTGTRVWEFALGGLLAVIGTAAARIPALLRTVVSLAGWGAIWFAVVTFNEQTVFPGYAAAVPVLGTLAVIWAGSDGAFRSIVGSSPAAQFLGRVSYSVYLWHWPLMVFALTAGQLTFMSKVILIAITVFLAFLTTNLVEDPIRRWKPLADGPFWKTLAVTALAMALIAVPAILVSQSTASLNLSETQRAHALVETNDCYGAGTIAGTLDCTEMNFGPSIPDQNLAVDDKATVYSEECYSEILDSAVKGCTVGDLESGVRVALIGDSHAANWYPALSEIAETNGWSLTSHLKSACPMSDALRTDPEPNVQASCADWNTALAEKLTALDTPYDVVIVAHSSNTGGRYGAEAVAVTGFRDSWKQLTDSGTKVIVLQDTPFMKEYTAECVVVAAGAAGQCAVPRENAFVDDRMVIAAEGLENVKVLGMTDLFCTDGMCDPVIGGVTVYRDTNHFTVTYAKTLAPYLQERLVKLAPQLG